MQLLTSVLGCGQQSDPILQVTTWYSCMEPNASKRCILTPGHKLSMFASNIAAMESTLKEITLCAIAGSSKCNLCVQFEFLGKGQ